eukprot:gene25654-32132_t
MPLRFKIISDYLASISDLNTLWQTSLQLIYIPISIHYNLFNITRSMVRRVTTRWGPVHDLAMERVDY